MMNKNEMKLVYELKLVLHMHGQSTAMNKVVNLDNLSSSPAITSGRRFVPRVQCPFYVFSFLLPTAYTNPNRRENEKARPDLTV